MIIWSFYVVLEKMFEVWCKQLIDLQNWCMEDRRDFIIIFFRISNFKVNISGKTTYRFATCWGYLPSLGIRALNVIVTNGLHLNICFHSAPVCPCGVFWSLLPRPKYLWEFSELLLYSFVLFNLHFTFYYFSYSVLSFSFNCLYWHERCCRRISARLPVCISLDRD